MSKTSDSRRGRGASALRLSVFVVLLGLAALALPSSDARAGQTPAEGDAMRLRMAQYDPEQTWIQGDILVLGARVFDNRCSPCHGEQGFGDGELADVLPIRPRNYHAEPLKWGTSPSRIATTVALGRSAVMPSFATALSEDEIWAVAYVVWRWLPSDSRTYDSPEEARKWTLP